MSRWAFTPARWIRRPAAPGLVGVAEILGVSYAVCEVEPTPGTGVRGIWDLGAHRRGVVHRVVDGPDGLTCGCEAAVYSDHEHTGELCKHLNAIILLYPDSFPDDPGV